MKKLYFLGLVALLSAALPAQAQLNITQAGYIPYNEVLSNIWGYTAPNGDEYALVGANGGLSIVDVTDPFNPIEVQYVLGPSSNWKEIKVWQQYAYVVSEGGWGLQIVDLSNLPLSVTSTTWEPVLTVNGVTETLNTIHAIYLDDAGYVYLTGSNINQGETIIADVHTDPMNPIYMGATLPQYTHDCYARGDTLYNADIYAGTFMIYDISDRTNPVFLASQNTPSAFTHNVWLSDNSQYIFTTDERPNAFVTAYDIADFSNIQEVDRYTNLATQGTGVIPHNTHVLNDYAVTSYYTDGVSIIDVHQPDNMVLVGQFDTYPGPQTQGFYGCWGVFPYFPSGTIVASDINYGLYVLSPTYVRASYLEGTVTDLISGLTLDNVSVTIVSTPIVEYSDLIGEYRTGIGTPGTYDVLYERAGYISQTITVNLSSGVTTVQDVQLLPLLNFSVEGLVVRADNGVPIREAEVEIENADYYFKTQTDAAGVFTFPAIFAGSYSARAGKWGFLTEEQNGFSVLGPVNGLQFALVEGYRDEFALDLGWTNGGTATSGDWTRATPQGVLYQNNPLAPDADVLNDIGTECYVTGANDNGAAGADDVDNGSQTLASPLFDVSSYNHPRFDFHYWFANAGGNGTPNDFLQVWLTNGTDTVLVEQFDIPTPFWQASITYEIAQFLTPDAAMQVLFTTFDDPNLGGNLVEAAIDLFQIYDSPLGEAATQSNSFSMTVFPNPSQSEFNVRLNTAGELAGELKVYDGLGRNTATYSLQPQQIIQFGSELPAGLYLLRYTDNQGTMATQSVLKTK